MGILLLSINLLTKCNFVIGYAEMYFQFINEDSLVGGNFK